MTWEAHLFFEGIPNFMQILEMQKRNQNTFFDFEKIAFDLVALKTRFE